jgi:cystathionine beta-synthase
MSRLEDLARRGVSESVLEAVGNTPLVRLNKVSESVDAAVLAKVEYLNPAGSAKDRTALFMVEEAEREGTLRPGGTIIEATSGNTGLGLAMVANARGYSLTIVTTDKAARTGKVDALRWRGAEVIVTPADAPYGHPEHFLSVAQRLAAERPNAFYTNQFGNPNNHEAHYRTTGPEIWAQTGGNVDCFVAGASTGGTLCGAGRYLKERNPHIRVVGVDPEGSVLYDHFMHGTQVEPRAYKTSGIGMEYVPAGVDSEIVDDWIQVSDHEAFVMAQRLAREEGLSVGSSSGAAVYAALRAAQHAGKGKTVVTVLPDSDARYVSTFKEWMQERGPVE